jgi:uncharacterized membrane protein (DUF373 family)
MAPKSKVRSSNERTILPEHFVDVLEDAFHGLLGIILFLVALGALFFTVERLLTTAPFFPTGMIQGVNDILFIVIILEILRTVIARFTDGVYQLDKFLIIGVIAAVRHILTVGASLTLGSTKDNDLFQRALLELGVNAGIVVALVLAIYMSKQAHGTKAKQ